jgi:NADH-quinone oxidoreductase subunit L
MAIPLVVLAIGSLAAGYVGVPHALGGGNRIERFLEPSFEAHRTAGPAVTEARPAPGPGVVPASADQAAGQHGPETAHAGDERTELMLMALSSGVAFAGIGIAVYFWLRNPAAADALARRFQPVYGLLYNKYYVDELYDALVVQPIKRLSTLVWRGFDAAVVDGAVNGVGFGVQGTSSALRRLQTGSVRTYAAALFLGAVLIVGYYLVG